VNRFNLRKTGEISHIESHDLRNAVCLHHGGKPRVRAAAYRDGFCLMNEGAGFFFPACPCCD
jgi:hypothetical protein